MSATARYRRAVRRLLRERRRAPRRRGCATVRRAAIERVREPRLPDAEERGLALHQRRADRRRASSRCSKAAARSRRRRAELAPFRFGAADWPTIVFVNGRYAPELSDCGALPARASRVLDLATRLARGAGARSSSTSARIAALRRRARSRRSTRRSSHDGAVVHIARDASARRADPPALRRRRDGGEGR